MVGRLMMFERAKCAEPVSTVAGAKEQKERELSRETGRPTAPPLSEIIGRR